MRRVLLFVIAFLGAFSQAQAQSYDFTPVTQLVDSFVGPGGQDLLDGASLIVIKDGQPIYQQNFGSYAHINPPTVSIASASKWLAALVLERLVESGQMSWDDTVADYFGTDYPNSDPEKGAITLGQLFSHTSGISSVSATCLSYQYRNMSLDKCAQQVLGMPLAYAPGSTFAYGENSMQVAGAMAQRATGKSWAVLLRSQLTRPLNLTDTDFGLNQRGKPFPNPIIAGGARSTMSDYSHVVQMVLQDGVFNGKRFLEASSIAEMQFDQTHGVPIDPQFDPYPEAFGYGYGEWRDEIDCNGVATHVSSTGAFGTSPWVDYDHGIAAVFLTYKQNPDPQVRGLISQVWAAVGDVIEAGSSASNRLSKIHRIACNP
ncbi:MAG: serine hydrolase domain-containing protein [Rhodanobacteraceae bacterium]